MSDERPDITEPDEFDDFVSGLRDEAQGEAELPTTTPRQTQLDIVKRQFRKNAGAVWGLRITFALIIFAIFAPAIASSEPFVYEAADGSTEFPWFRKLFDVIVWEHGLDRVFNLLMVTCVVYGLGACVLRFVPGTVDQSSKRRKVFRLSVLGLFLAVAILQSTGIALTTSEPKVDYLAPRKEWRQAEFDLRMARRALESVRARGEDTTLAEEDVSSAEELEQATRKAFDDTWMILPPVPYGYRDGLPLLEDKFLPAGSFEHGETHLFGTGETGRDVFTRILYGTRISLTIGIFAVAIYITIGTFFGALAGYFRGKVDLTIMRVVEIILCVPGLFLLLTIVAFFDKSIWVIMFAIGITGWTGITRLVRGEFLRERNKEYVDAARSMGFSTPRIIFRHVLPNAVGPVLVAATFGVPGAILAESGLSFLGLGDTSVPSWGRLLYDARTHEYWHLIVPPSVAIFLTVTALNLVGDGLRDALDPKLRN